LKYKFFVIISALPVQGKSLTVQKWDRVTLQIEQDINDIKETKTYTSKYNIAYFLTYHKGISSLQTLSFTEKRICINLLVTHIHLCSIKSSFLWNIILHDNPSLTICSVDLKDSTINYVCIVLHKDDKIESFKWRLRVIPQGMCLYIITEIYLMYLHCICCYLAEY
jgi:hypothetical protein